MASRVRFSEGRKKLMKRKKRTNQEGGPGMSEREFAAILANFIAREGGCLPPGYDAERFSLIGAGGKTLRLGDAFKAYRQTPPWGRPDLLRRLTRCWFMDKSPVPEAFDEAKSNILPVLWRRSTYGCDLLEQQGGGQRADPRRVFAEHLVVGAAFDWPDGIAYLNEEQFSSWGITLDDALDVAFANLQNLSRDGLVESAPGFWVSPWNDSYDSARILLRDVIERCKVKGLHVAMCPNRSSLIVTGSEDDEGLARMASLVEESFEGPRFLSGIPTLVVGDRSTPFELPQGHPLRQRFQSLAHLTLARDYARQTELLTTSCVAKSGSAFVASVMVTRDPDWATVSTLTAGVDTLLPKTQAVAFAVPGKDMRTYNFLALGEWGRVRVVMGDLMERWDLYPERYRVRSFPTPEQLREIKGDGPDLLLAMLQRGG
jgi:hypothetical protein